MTLLRATPIAVAALLVGCATPKSAGEYRSEADQLVQGEINQEIMVVHANVADLLRKCTFGFAAVNADFYGDRSTISVSNKGETIAVVDLSAVSDKSTMLKMPVVTGGTLSTYVPKRILSWASGKKVDCD